MHCMKKEENKVELIFWGGDKKKKTEVRVLCNNECIHIKRYKNMTTKTLRDLKSWKLI